MSRAATPQTRGDRRSGHRRRFSAFCVAFINFDESAEGAATAAQYLQATFPGGITIIAVAHEPDAALVLTAMRSGCSEFLSANGGTDELAELMDRLELLSLHTEHKMASPGIILSLVGVKGGVGTTSVAVIPRGFDLQGARKAYAADRRPHGAWPRVHLPWPGRQPRSFR